MVQTEIDSLAAPSEDGGLLIWPNARQLPVLFEQNQKLRRTYRFKLLDCDAHDLIAPSLDAKMIATGHQPGFLHPGVWIKNVAASALACRGVAQFFVVDNDALQQSALRWPERVNGGLRLRSAYPFQFSLDRPYELLPESTSQEWEQFFAILPDTLRTDSQSMMPAFLNGFLDAGPDRSYVARWINGIRSIERQLDVPHPAYSPISQWFDVSKSRAAAHFVGHLIEHSDEFAAAYNSALRNYRERRGIRGHQHPIPDLTTTNERTEVAFWGVHPELPRQRLSVQHMGDRILLYAGAERIAELNKADLRCTPGDHLQHALGTWRIRPRALTLTMFTRLLCCDLFIHGIGGAKYDQICDDCIRTFFGVEPPAYACVSATLRLDLPRFDVGPENMIRCRREMRNKLYNPQRFLNREDAEVSALSSEKDSAIAAASQLRDGDPHNHSARKSAAEQIRLINAALAAKIPTDNGCDIDTLESRVAQNKIADYREWFMGFYPRNKLALLAERVSTELEQDNR